MEGEKSNDKARILEECEGKARRERKADLPGGGRKLVGRIVKHKPETPEEDPSQQWIHFPV